MVPLSELDTHNYAQILKFKEALGSEKVDIAESEIVPEESLNAAGQNAKIVHKLREKQKRLSKEEIAEIVQEYKIGVYMTELARKFGCHESTIRRKLREAEVKE